MDKQIWDGGNGRLSGQRNFSALLVQVCIV